MKKIFPALAFLLLLSISGQALDASISYATFKSPQQKYVEVYLYIVGQTTTYVPLSTDTTMAQAKVEVVILFKQNGEIAKFDKYILNGPLSQTQENFVDLKRFVLEDGTYDIEVSIQDLNNAENVKNFKGDFEMKFPDDETKLLQSDIQLLASVKKSDEQHVLVKNGFFLEPLPFNFYNKTATKLIFYNEVYDTDKKIGDDFQVTYGIKKIVNQKASTVLIGHKKRNPKPVNVLILQMDISKLESGNYQLFIEIRNRQKELLSQKVIEFVRSNPYLDVSHEATQSVKIEDEFVAKLTRDELKYSLKAIAPLVNEGDVELLNSVIANKDSTIQQRFLFNFWANQNPNRPDVTYKAFMEIAKAVDKTFASGFGFGFESDRGYTYIRYGQPDDIIKVDNDPSAPPYEIWFYNDFPMTSQSDVRFLFYSPDLATSYQLLHSTARGERNNPQWALELYRNVPNEVQGANYIDATNMQDNWFRYASRYFNEN